MASYLDPGDSWRRNAGDASAHGDDRRRIKDTSSEHESRRYSRDDRRYSTYSDSSRDKLGPGGKYIERRQTPSPSPKPRRSSLARPGTRRRSRSHVRFQESSSESDFDFDSDPEDRYIRSTTYREQKPDDAFVREKRSQRSGSPPRERVGIGHIRHRPHDLERKTSSKNLMFRRERESLENDEAQALKRATSESHESHRGDLGSDAGGRREYIAERKYAERGRRREEEESLKGKAKYMPVVVTDSSGYGSVVEQPRKSDNDRYASPRHEGQDAEKRRHERHDEDKHPRHERMKPRSDRERRYEDDKLYISTRESKRRRSDAETSGLVSRLETRRRSPRSDHGDRLPSAAADRESSYEEKMFRDRLKDGSQYYGSDRRYYKASVAIVDGVKQLYI